MSYGQSFKVESWAVQLFAEEVVRGGPAFAVSLAISNIEPGLRNAAALGAWQVRSSICLLSGVRWGGLLLKITSFWKSQVSHSVTDSGTVKRLERKASDWFMAFFCI